METPVWEVGAQAVAKIAQEASLSIDEILANPEKHPVESVKMGEFLAWHEATDRDAIVVRAREIWFTVRRDKLLQGLDL